MITKKSVSCALLIVSSAIFVSAQTNSKQKNISSSIIINNFGASSPAFAEIILRKTELEAELESLLVSYTEEFPKVAEIRFEFDSLKRAIERLSTVKAAESSKLTLALGKLMVRKAELETDLWNLRKRYDDNNQEVKRARRKIEIYEAAIKEILG
jgi:hypothetical protein